MDSLYTLEKFHEAVDHLALGDGDFRARLSVALYPLINLRGLTRNCLGSQPRSHACLRRDHRVGPERRLRFLVTLFDA